ncbi:alpha/beta hydrolase fold domain-containing protein [Parahaliea mediterranea]|uniref:alpha/beta hydrolase fold domain-containing protein n=1 Tax=Parahaliea mediterranea TaxID=651086 RepID=UPI000E2EFC8D|nr:alpha/beta hydrolase fold domain-containing protein [Parahaliea mediterranea]
MPYPIDADGTVHLGDHRVPIPDSISPEARAYLASNPWGDAPVPDEPVPMWTLRDAMAPAFEGLNQHAQALYPVEIQEETINGVRCHRIQAADASQRIPGKALLNMHGGGFVVGSGALVEAIPVASMTGITVIAVDYRLAPEHPYPAALDDIIAVYRHCLEEFGGGNIGLFGSSAGGFLSGQAVIRLQQVEQLPLPACVGMYSAGGNLFDFGDTRNIFTLSGFYGQPSLPLGHELSEVGAYLGGADPHDPILSPETADLSQFPPSLLASGTRDALLSAASNFHRALRRAGRASEILVYDAMPHSHWYALELPETREFFAFQADFYRQHLGE